MDKGDIQLVGGACGQHGPYTFYKAFKYTKNGIKRIVTLSEFFFVKLWIDSDLLCIGELQLLWCDKNSDQVLASLRLYFLPENTPEGRTDHGEDEVLAIAEKVVLRVEDLITWITVDAEWTWGRLARCKEEVKDPPPHSEDDLHKRLEQEHDHQNHQISADNGNSDVASMDFSDVENEKQSINNNTIEATGPLVVILSYPRYCRYRAMMRRLEGVENDYLKYKIVNALGGFAACTRNTRVLFCKDTFDYPELEGHELLCNHLAPKLKGRPRGKRKKRSVSPGGSESNESESSVSNLTSNSSKDLPDGRSNGLRCDNLRRSTRSVDNNSEGREFLKELTVFMKTNYTPIGKIPSLGYKELDLYSFYTKVHKLGGYDSVTSNRLWKTVFDDMHGHANSTSAATVIRRHYERFLLPYERHLKGEEYKPLPISERRRLKSKSASDAETSESTSSSRSGTSTPVPHLVPATNSSSNSENKEYNINNSPNNPKVASPVDVKSPTPSTSPSSLRSVRVKTERQNQKENPTEACGNDTSAVKSEAEEKPSTVDNNMTNNNEDDVKPEIKSEPVDLITSDIPVCSNDEDCKPSEAKVKLESDNNQTTDDNKPEPEQNDSPSDNNESKTSESLPPSSSSNSDFSINVNVNVKIEVSAANTDTLLNQTNQVIKTTSPPPHSPPSIVTPMNKPMMVVIEKNLQPLTTALTPCDVEKQSPVGDKDDGKDTPQPATILLEVPTFAGSDKQETEVIDLVDSPNPQVPCHFTSGAIIKHQPYLNLPQPSAATTVDIIDVNVNVKKRKLDILKEGGLEVTPVKSITMETTISGVLPTVTTKDSRPSVIQPTLMLQQPPNVSKSKGEAKPSKIPHTPTKSLASYDSAGAAQLPPPRVHQSRSIFSHSEKIVYGNPKDFAPSPSVPYLQMAAAPRVAPRHSGGDILDLTVTSPQKPVVEIMKIPASHSNMNINTTPAHFNLNPAHSRAGVYNLSNSFNQASAPVKNNRQAQPPAAVPHSPVIDGRRLGSNLEITLVNNKAHGNKPKSSKSTHNLVNNNNKINYPGAHTNNKRPMAAYYDSYGGPYGNVNNGTSSKVPRIETSGSKSINHLPALPTSGSLYGVPNSRNNINKPISTNSSSSSKNIYTSSSANTMSSTMSKNYMPQFYLPHHQQHQPHDVLSSSALIGNSAYGTNKTPTKSSSSKNGAPPPSPSPTAPNPYLSFLDPFYSLYAGTLGGAAPMLPFAPVAPHLPPHSASSGGLSTEQLKWYADLVTRGGSNLMSNRGGFFPFPLLGGEANNGGYHANSNIKKQ